MRRFKDRHTAEVNARSVDFSKMELQPGDAEPEPFSFSTDKVPDNSRCLLLTYTNEHTHQIIRDNLDRSPIYSGVIQGVGPRYCPSIETKVMTFADKPRHQLFVEPMGLDTEELLYPGLFLVAARRGAGRDAAHYPRLGARGNDPLRLRDGNMTASTRRSSTRRLSKKDSRPVRRGAVQRLLRL